LNQDPGKVIIELGPSFKLELMHLLQVKRDFVRKRCRRLITRIELGSRNNMIMDLIDVNVRWCRAVWTAYMGNRLGYMAHQLDFKLKDKANAPYSWFATTFRAVLPRARAMSILST
jgi:hypothetical protein